MNETAKLKPCPFCGGEARIEVIKPHTHTLTTFMPDYKGGAFIECKCGAAISGDTKDAAMAAWNKRAQDTEAKRRRTEGNPKALTLDELREMAAKCEPIYISRIDDGTPIFRGNKIVGGILDMAAVMNITTHLPLMAIYGRNLTLAESDYGKTWLAYRTKPEDDK